MEIVTFLEVAQLKPEGTTSLSNEGPWSGEEPVFLLHEAVISIAAAPAMTHNIKLCKRIPAGFIIRILNKDTLAKCLSQAIIRKWAVFGGIYIIKEPSFAERPFHTNQKPTLGKSMRINFGVIPVA